MRVKPGTKIGTYEVEEAIGWGGFATVYRVREMRDHSVHALKVLLGRSRDSHSRLVTEGRVQSNLKHENIVHVSEILDVDGVPGLVMEYFPAPSLGQWLSLYRPDIQETESLFQGILAGVAHAHSQGVVHRDLKPGNVLLAASDVAITPKVADFGLAKLFGDESGGQGTRTGMTMGTPAYMPPEQLRDAKGTDQRADIWALGCLLYELIMGRAPFSETLDLIRLHERMMASDWLALPLETPTAIRTVVARCLAPNRDERPADCASVLAMLGPAGPSPEWQTGAFRAIRVWRSMDQGGEPSFDSMWAKADAPPTMFPDAPDSGAGGSERSATLGEAAMAADSRERISRQLAEMQAAARVVDRELNDAIALSEREESGLRAQFVAHHQRDDVLRQTAIAVTAGGIGLGAIAGWFAAEWWGAAAGVLAGAALGLRLTIPKVQAANRVRAGMLEAWRGIGEDRREAVDESRALAQRITVRAGLLAAEATAIAMIPSVPNVRGILGRVAPTPAPLGEEGRIPPVTPLAGMLATLSLVLSASLVAAGLATQPEPVPDPVVGVALEVVPAPDTIGEPPVGDPAMQVPVKDVPKTSVPRAPQVSAGKWRGSVGMATLSGELVEKNGVLSGTLACSGRDVVPGACVVTGKVSAGGSVTLVLAGCAASGTLKGKLSGDKLRVSGTRTGADGATETWALRFVPG